MDEKLNKYLNEVAGYLNDIEITKKSRIILEIEERIKEAAKSESIDQVLLDLGSPINLANHYRIEQNLQTIHVQRQKSFSPLKWILSLMGFFFITSLIAGGILIWQFTPVFKIDEEQNRFVLLGGLIDINGKSGRIKLMDQYHYIDNQFTNSFDGSIDIENEEYDELVLNFKSGVIEIANSESNTLSWDCKLDSPPTDEFINKDRGIIELDLEKLEGISCAIKIPSTVKLTIDGKDGVITINEPEFDVFVELTNGSINFAANPEFEYKFDIEITKGSSDQFQSSKNEEALEVKLTLENGVISKLE